MISQSKIGDSHRSSNSTATGPDTHQLSRNLYPVGKSVIIESQRLSQYQNQYELNKSFIDNYSVINPSEPNIRSSK